jgi:amino acid transporter
MMPASGGYISWVVEGLGPVAGFVNACNAQAGALCNLPLYLVSVSAYIAALYPDASERVLALIRLACISIVLALNIAGVESMEVAGLLFSVVAQLPFLIIPIAAAVSGGSGEFQWDATMVVVDGEKFQFALFFSTLCWNSQGWMNVGGSSC